MNSQQFFRFLSAERTLIPNYLNASLLLLLTAFVVFRLYERDVFGYFEPFFYLGMLYAFYGYSPAIIRRFGWVVLPAIAIPILSWLFMRIDFPDVDLRGPRPEDFLDKFVFIFMGFILFLNKGRIVFFLLLSAFVVLFIPFFVGYGFEELMHGLNGQRVGFGLVAIRTALLFGLVLIGFLCFGFFSDVNFILRFFILVISVFCFIIIILTQTRSAILGFSFSFLFVMLLMLKSRVSFRDLIASFSILFFTLFLVLNTGLFDPIVKRFEAELVDISSFVESRGDVGAVTRSSVGLRLKFWHAAVDYGSERPIFGWGYKGGDLVMELSGVITKENTFINTVHNGFLELFVRYGLAGFFLFLGVVSTVLLFFYKAVGFGLVPRWLAFFVPSSLIYFSVIAMFTSDLFYWQSLYAFNIIMAVAAAYAFDYLLKNKGGSPDGG